MFQMATLSRLARKSWFYYVQCSPPPDTAVDLLGLQEEFFEAPGKPVQYRCRFSGATEVSNDVPVSAFLESEETEQIKSDVTVLARGQNQNFHVFKLP